MMPLFGWGEYGTKCEEVETLLWGVATRALELGVNVVLDSGLWSRAERDDFHSRAEARGTHVVLHVLDLPLEVLWERVERRNAHLQPDEVPITQPQLEAFEQVYQRPTLEERAGYEGQP